MKTISLASGYGNFAVPEVALAAASAASADAQLTNARQRHAPLRIRKPTDGQSELREALAQRYRQRGARGIVAEQVVVTNGAKNGLLALLSELLVAGDEVLLPTPNWFGFFELVYKTEGGLRTLPLKAADNYELRLDALRAAITPATRLLILSNPNNPTGRVYSREDWAELLALTADFPDLWVLSDEIYEGINFGPAPVPTLLAMPGPHQQHVVVSGFSKSLALVGWDVGCLVAPLPLARAVAARLFRTGAVVPMRTQAAALAATQHAEAISAALCQQLLPTRKLLLEGLAALPGAGSVIAPEGTYYVFADFTRFLDAGLPAAEASAQLVRQLAKAGVEVVDGASCGAPGFVRLSYAVPEADLRQALALMQRTFVLK